MGIEKMVTSINYKTRGAGRKLRTAIIGGGQGCKAVLELVVEGRMSTFNLEILCVVDPNPRSPGIVYAQELGIFTSTVMKKILEFKALDLIIELTGSDQILAEIYRFIPSGTRVLDHTVARVFWDLNEADQNLRKQLQEKIELEEQLKRDRKQLQDIINSLGDAIIVMDQGFIIEAVNAEFIKNTGLASDQVIGRECCEVLREKFGSVWGYDSQCLVKEVIKTGKTRREIREGVGHRGEEIYYEYLNKMKNGELYYEATSISAIRDSSWDITHYVRVGTDISDKKKTEGELQRSEQELRELSTHMRQIREEERKSIARNIHDNLGQSLTALKIDMSWLIKRLSDEQLPLIEKANEMATMIDQNIQTVKKISSELRPEVLDILGLVAAIEWYAEEFSERTGIKCALNLGEDDIIRYEDDYGRTG